MGLIDLVWRGLFSPFLKTSCRSPDPQCRESNPAENSRQAKNATNSIFTSSLRFRSGLRCVRLAVVNRRQVYHAIIGQQGQIQTVFQIAAVDGVMGEATPLKW